MTDIIVSMRTLFNFSKSAFLRGFVVLVSMVLFYGCAKIIHEMPENKRDLFVDKFLKSMEEDSDFYKKFMNEKEVPEVTKFRGHLLLGPFKIVKWDGPFMDDECYVMLSDSSSIYLYVRQRWGKAESVHVYWYPKVVDANS